MTNSILRFSGSNNGNNGQRPPKLDLDAIEIARQNDLFAKAQELSKQIKAGILQAPVSDRNNVYSPSLKNQDLIIQRSLENSIQSVVQHTLMSPPDKPNTLKPS